MTVDPTVKQVQQAERALYAAMIAKDYGAFEAILSPDLVYVHSTAVAESKEEYLAGVARGWYDYESIVTRDATVRVHGNVALIDGICSMRVGTTGQPREAIQLLFVLVWIRDGATWRLEHRHATRIPAT